MDMPEDTPTKVQYKKSSSDLSQNFEEYQDDQNFSSFDSNGPKHDMKQSSLSIDQNGFRNMQIHRQKMMIFPEMPTQIAKLYQIYLHNVNRKKELKRIIQELIQKQIKAIRITYDKQALSIEQFNDLDQESKQYLASKQNYEKREKQLQSLNRHYRELKVMQVESMMVLDPQMKKTLLNFTQKTKKIVHVDVQLENVLILTNERQKKQRIRKLRQKKGTRKQLKSQEQNEQELLNALEKGGKSRNTSRTVSEDEDENEKLKEKYLLRRFKFFKTQHGISFEPFQQLVQLPEKMYVGFFCLFSDKNHKHYLVYQEKKLYIISSVGAENQKYPSIQNQYSYDSPIIFCRAKQALLYVGTQDGIIRKYSICYFSENVKLQLKQIVLCTIPNSEPQPITHISLTPNPDILLFSRQDNNLYEINLSNYTTYLLSHLPQKIQFMDQRLIITKSCMYLDYYVSGAGGIGHGKAVLLFNNKLKMLAKNRNIVKIVKINKQQDFIVFSEGNGVFSVQKFTLQEQPKK